MGNTAAFGRGFNGSIDEFTVWNRTLEQAEITSIYETGQFNKFGIYSMNQTLDANYTPKWLTWTCINTTQNNCTAQASNDTQAWVSCTESPCDISALSQTDKLYINVTLSSEYTNSSPTLTYLNVSYTPSSDTISPTWNSFTNTANASTTTGSNAMFSINMEDETMLDTAIFAMNTTGTLNNISITKLSSSSAIVRNSIQVNNLPNTMICGQYWMNDTNNNINQTNISCFTVQTSPQLDTEIILIGIAMLFSILITYKISWIMGNISFIAIGILTMIISQTNTIQACGIMIIASSIANTIYDLMPYRG